MIHFCSHFIPAFMFMKQPFHDCWQPTAIEYISYFLMIHKADIVPIFSRKNIGSHINAYVHQNGGFIR